jgi:WD40 repeat protein
MASAYIDSYHDWPSYAFAADSKTLVAITSTKESIRNRIALWDLASRKELATLPNPEDFVYVLAAFAPDGKTLAAITMGEWRCERFIDGKIVPEGRITWKRTDPTGAGSSGAPLMSMHPVYQLHLWDVATRTERKRFVVGWQGTMEKLAFSSDGQFVYVLANVDEKVWGGIPTVNHLRVWDVATGQERGSIGDGGTRFHGLAFTADNRLLALTDQRLNDRRPNGYSSLYRIRTWDVERQQELAGSQAFTATELPVDVDPQSQKVAPNSPHKEDAWESAFRWGSHNSTVVSADGKVKAVRAYAWPSQKSGPGGKVITTGSPTDVQIIDNATGEVKHVLKGFGQWVTRLAFTPDGKTLAMGDYHGRIKLWNVAAGRELLTIQAHSGPISGLAFRPDGKALASSSDAEIRLWRAETSE